MRNDSNYYKAIKAETYALLRDGRSAVLNCRTDILPTCRRWKKEHLRALIEMNHCRIGSD